VNGLVPTCPEECPLNPTTDGEGSWAGDSLDDTVEHGTPDADADDFLALRAMRLSRAMVPPRLRASFSMRYIGALVMVAVLAGAAFATVELLVHAQASAAAVVNVAGRQRMLSQRIALDAGLLAGSTGPTRAALAARLSTRPSQAV
jgi:hypothetical protein